jgi:hypothetical protein
MQGQTYASSFYWNYDAKTRAFADRFFAKMKKMPTNLQAADCWRRQLSEGGERDQLARP